MGDAAAFRDRFGIDGEHPPSDAIDHDILSKKIVTSPLDRLFDPNRLAWLAPPSRSRGDPSKGGHQAFGR